ncbi:MAG: ATP-binding protein [Deinococcota bacterium]
MAKRLDLLAISILWGLFLIILLSGFWFAPSPRLEQGVMDLRNWDFNSAGAVSIVGEAEFYWQQLLTPKDFVEHTSRVGQSPSPGATASLGTPERFSTAASSGVTNAPNSEQVSDTDNNLENPDLNPENPATDAETLLTDNPIDSPVSQVPRLDGYIAIPKAWNGFEVDGKPISGDGYGTYRFQIQLSQRVDQLAFNLPEVDSAYVLYINGQVRASNGRVGRSPTETQAEWLPQLVTLDGNSTSLEIILQASNFEHRRGGAGQLIRLGTEAQIVGSYRANLALRLFILGGALTMGFYHLAFFILRRDDASSIMFSAICFLIALRILASASGNMFMHQVIPELNWQLFVKVNYLSFYLLPTVFAMFLEKLFPKEMPTWFIRVLQVLSLLYGTIVLTTRTQIFTHTLLSYQLITVLMSGCCMYVLTRAVQHGRKGAVTFFVSSLLLVGTVINDVLYNNQLIYTGYLLPFGVFAFICAQAFVLLRRFAKAFSEVESLTKTLEQRVAKRTEQLVASNRRLLRSNTVLQDEITERKRIGEALTAAKLAAESANQAKSSFIAQMSHELRTPLTAILGYAQLLKLDDDVSAEQHEGLDIIEQSGDHLLTLINDVLDMAAIEAGKLTVNKQDVALAGFLRRISDIVRVRTEQKNLNFVYEPYDFQTQTRLDTLPQTVHADPKLIRQVLINLLGNAVKFTDQGHIVFRVGPVADGRFRFEIEDSGIGIAGDALETIFQPFQQVSDSKRQAEGTGLGLAISHNLIDLMGGKLQVSSRLGMGSNCYFELELALVSSQQVPASEPARRIVGIDGASPRLLLVDDNDLNRAVLSTLLRPLGFHIVEARDGAEALELAQTQPLDAVITDLMMPVMDGFDMTRALRAEDALTQLVIIATSASVFNEDREKSMQAGCNDFLAKPIKPKALLTMLEHYLHITWRYQAAQPRAAQPQAAQPQAAQPRAAQSRAVTSAAQHTNKVHADAPEVLEPALDTPNQDTPNDVNKDPATSLG